MPSPVRCFTALSPSLVSGHLTTTLGATCASSLPSFTMPSKSVATTSRLTSPGTTLQISSTSGRNGRFSLAISEGLVVQPSTRPMATPSRSSFTFAESRKIFIASSVSCALHADRGPGAHRLEHLGIAEHAAEYVDRAGRPDLGAAAGRRGPVEDAERGARRPVAQIAELHHLPGILALGLHRDREVDLVAPDLARDAERQGLPDRGGGRRAVEDRVRGHLAHRDPDLSVSHGDARWARASVASGPGRSQAPPGSPALPAPVRGEPRLQRGAIGNRRDALALHGGRRAARRHRGRVPRVAVPVVGGEERGREDVARPVLVLLPRHVALVPVA